MDGMQVIRLEHPKYGDPNRFIGENVLGEKRMNAYFLTINAGKKALTLNLTEPEGQEIFHAIIRDLKLRRPRYLPTAAYGHFGREDLDLPWENLGKLEELKAAAPSEAVSAD